MADAWPNQRKYTDITPGDWPDNDEPTRRNNPEIQPGELELPVIQMPAPDNRFHDDHLYSDNGPLIRNGGRNERTPFH